MLFTLQLYQQKSWRMHEKLSFAYKEIEQKQLELFNAIF